jgi:hypothetical protein
LVRVLVEMKSVILVRLLEVSTYVREMSRFQYSGMVLVVRRGCAGAMVVAIQLVVGKARAAWIKGNESILAYGRLKGMDMDQWDPLQGST